MIFHAFQREDDDSVFTVAKNVTASTMTVGEAVVWDSGTPDGVRVTAPVATTLSLFRGIVAEAIVASGYGKVQVHGYCAAAKVLNDITTAQTAGNILLIATNANVLGGTSGSVAGDGKSGFVYALEAYATATAGAVTTTTKKVLIRAL
jgi:hypothetical protein